MGMQFEAVVITGSLLWWSLMAAQMGARILSAWNYASLDHLDFACKHFPNCPLYNGSVMGVAEMALW